MNILEWDKSFEVDNETINEQHQVLIGIINKYIVMGKNNPEVISEVLSEMTDYTFFHFGYEEELMKESNTQYYDQHKKEHTSFVEYVAKLCLQLLSSSDFNHDEFMLFLTNWLKKHILTTDMETFQTTS